MARSVKNRRSLPALPEGEPRAPHPSRRCRATFPPGGRFFWRCRARVWMGMRRFWRDGPSSVSPSGRLPPGEGLPSQSKIGDLCQLSRRESQGPSSVTALPCHLPPPRGKVFGRRMQKAQPVRLRFLQQEKRRGKMKRGKNQIYVIARSDIRAAVCFVLYGFIISCNC